MLISFAVRGSLRFLSHAETLRLFQRACIRAAAPAGSRQNWSLAYSQGFNPRLKLSLPLPRTVGVESDDDFLCIRINLARQPDSQPSSFDSEHFKAELASQLPAGCELLSISMAGPKTSVAPSQAAYVLQVRPEYLNENLETAIKHLLASESLKMKRQMDAKGSKFKNVDVRGFIKSIELRDADIIIECKISSEGSIRVDEILKLLELDADMLAAPLRRTNIKWSVN